MSQALPSKQEAPQYGLRSDQDGRSPHSDSVGARQSPFGPPVKELPEDHTHCNPFLEKPFPTPRADKHSQVNLSVSPAQGELPAENGLEIVH